MDKKVDNNTAKPGNDSRSQRPGGRNVRGRKTSKRKYVDQDPDIDKKIISIRRVSRMYKGGKRMRLSVAVAVGDRKGKVGIGTGKGADVRSAEEKAIKQARKNMIKVNTKGSTIPHTVTFKKGASVVLLKPATPGTGIIAGGPVRAIVELAGVKDVLSKVLGSNNKIGNAQATLEALENMLVRAK